MEAEKKEYRWKISIIRGKDILSEHGTKLSFESKSATNIHDDPTVIWWELIP